MTPGGWGSLSLCVCGKGGGPVNEWTVVTALSVVAGLVAAVFLLIVRLRPRLREELGRRFHT